MNTMIVFALGKNHKIPDEIIDEVEKDLDETGIPYGFVELFEGPETRAILIHGIPEDEVEYFNEALSKIWRKYYEKFNGPLDHESTVVQGFFS